MIIIILRDSLKKGGSLALNRIKTDNPALNRK